MQSRSSFPSIPDETPAARPDLTAWLLLAALGMIWGGSFATTGAAVATLPPLTVAAARLVLAAALLLPLCYWLADGLPSRRTETGKRIWLAALGAAFAANAAPFALLSWAQTHIPSGLAGVFMASLPLIVLPLAARFVPGERMTAAKLAGFTVGFVGVGVLIGGDVLSGLGGGGLVSLLAQFACLAAAAGYAVGSIITKLSPRTHPTSFGAATMLLAAPMATALAFAVEAPFAANWTPAASLAVIFLGVFPTALAMLMLYEVVRRAGPSFLSLVNYQVPLWALAFGVAFLGETPPAQTPWALALILAGVAISQGAVRRLFARRVDGAAADRR